MRQPFRPATCQDVTDFSLLLVAAAVKQMFQHLLLMHKKTPRKFVGDGCSPITTMLRSFFLFFFCESD